MALRLAVFPEPSDSISARQDLNPSIHLTTKGSRPKDLDQAYVKVRIHCWTQSVPTLDH